MLRDIIITKDNVSNFIKLVKKLIIEINRNKSHKAHSSQYLEKYLYYWNNELKTQHHEY
jgi:hypothetical protein